MTEEQPPVGPPVPDLTRFPHSGFGASTLRQAVLDAAAVLQVRRRELAAALADGRTTSAAEVVATDDVTDRWLVDHRSGWREVLVVQPSATAAQLRTWLPQLRQVLDAGARAVTLFDHDGLDVDARPLLAAETLGSHKVAICPVRMRIVNRRSLLLQGPEVDGAGTVMKVDAGPCLEAAWAYWDAALASSVPADNVDVLDGLTPRQRQVMGLLAADLGDEAIATALEVSVRTVRSDIAAVMERLGVRTRFAAGNRLRVWEETGHPPPR